MASRGNYHARNKSQRGRGSSHPHGENIHKSTGNLFHQSSSYANSQQKRNSSGRGGQNFRGRGGFHMSSEDFHGNKIPGASSGFYMSSEDFHGNKIPGASSGFYMSSEDFHGNKIPGASIGLNPNFQQQQSTPGSGGHAYQGKGGLFQQNEHRSDRNPGFANARNFHDQHTHFSGRRYTPKDHYEDEHHTSQGNVHHLSTGYETKPTSNFSEKRNINFKTSGSPASSSGVPSPDFQSKVHTSQSARATHFRTTSTTRGYSHTKTSSTDPRRNVPFKSADSRLTSNNSVPPKVSQNVTTATEPGEKNINTASNSAPRTIIRRKSKKLPDSKKYQRVNSTSKTSTSEGNENSRKPQSKRKKWNKYRKPFQLIQNPSESNLLTFSRAVPGPSHVSVYDESDSDGSDSISTVSHCSSNDNDVDTLQDFGVSEESDSSSEENDDISVSSGIDTLKSESIRSDVLKQVCSQESFVAVYWDIENCPVPSKKSAIDVIKKIRDTFYENRTETEFVIACDVRNLTKRVAKELGEAFVTVVFADSSNKNAADKKLLLRMNMFQCRYQKTNSAVVLISGDSDFADVLQFMRYHQWFYVNVLCNKLSKGILQHAAHNCMLYEDFVKDLPDSKAENNTEFCMRVSGFPTNTERSIKNHLNSVIKNVNGKVRSVSGSIAELVFSDASARERAQKLLEGTVICGSAVSLMCYTRSYDRIQPNSSRMDDFKETVELPGGSDLTSALGTPSQDKHSNKENQGMQTKAKKKNKSGKNTTESSSGGSMDKLSDKTDPTNSVNSKNASLVVSVQYRTDDVDFWKEKFMSLFKTPNISIHKDNSSFAGFFLISFSSIGRAQKARKKIQKAQEADPSAPKYIKFIQDDVILSTSVGNSKQNNINSSAGKTEEIKKIMEMKKQHFLREFEGKLNELKKQCCGKSVEESEIVKHKIDELKQQRIVFLQYNNHVLQKLASLSQQVKPNMEQIFEEHLKDYSRECACFTEGLPIYARRDDIIRTVKKNQVVLIRAETGSGKSTQIIQYLWRNGFGENGVIVCTQPRKLAAVSIAKHVSNQIGSPLGGIVGYQVGLSSKKSEKTQILFMTDYTMLKMCVNDELFQNVSCVIIDEAHERSIYTDLLLGMIKSALSKHKDLRVIVTSATIDISVFRSYFGLPGDAVLQISGRTFPIEDVWLDNDVSVGWNYLEKSVSVALDLLKEDPGDILVFLTTPLETEQASTLIKEKLESNKKVIVHYLHGKLDVAEQQKVFVPVPKGSRKIVFATNCAETSITIPGIRYVIDSGMVKESKYDAVRNLNVLSVGFVSRSSAEQRRGRAGRTQSGKCYRLYSKSNYQNGMTANTEPEILRVNLGQALLKLMELGVQDPTYFDFVESPSRESLMASMKQLTHLGAVDRMDRKLSELGQKMAKLPLEPRLSHLIFKGIDQNIGYESVVVAALATVSRNIFFRNEDNRKEADAKKVRFCQSESDFLTYFEIFKEWINTPKADRSQWCMLNCINAKSMRIALELVTELLETVRRELNVQIKSRFSDDENFVQIIHSIIFYSFSENLCVFSGYYKFGYHSPSLPGEFHVHPSSSLCYVGHWKPRYIVYDTILKTSQAYLLNVTPVSKEAVEYAVECGWLPYSLDVLENLSLCPYQIGPIGETILKKSVLGKRGGKRVALEQQLQKLIGDKSCAIEVKFNKGEIIVHLASCYHHCVEEVIFPVITETQQQMFDEQKICAISDLPELGLVFGCCAEIKEIVLPGEFRTVEVKLNASISFDSVLEELGKFGEIHLVKDYQTHSKVTFSYVASAMDAFMKLKNHRDFTLRPQLKHHEMHKGEKFFKVSISILRRPCTGIAYISFKSPGDFPEACSRLCGTHILYDQSVLQIQMSRNDEELMIKKLPANATKEKLRQLLKLYLPSYVEIKDVKLIRIKEFESKKNDVAEIKQEITRMICNYTPDHKVDIEFKNVKPKDFTWNAWAYFHNSQDGQITVNALSGRSVMVSGQQQLLEMKPMLSNTLFCDSEIFVAVKDQIDEALEFYKKGKSESDQLKIFAKKDEKKPGVIITITSNNLRDITDARNCIMNILVGDKIHCEGNQHLEKLFLQQGKSFLKDLEAKMKNICIKPNTKSKVITLFGSEALCSIAKTRINTYLDTLSMENTVDICLKSDDFPKGLMRELVKKYGYNMDDLRTHCSLQSVEINTSNHMLTVTGDTPSINKVKEVLEETSKILCENVRFGGDDAEICPICFLPVDAKFHRLEYCGHACCRECILLMFRSQDIPLECPSEDCKMPIVVEDINWVLKEDKELADQLYHKALERFVEKSKNSIHHCPTPDCLMVYRANHGEDHKFYCPSCQNDICTKCHAVYHYGMTCEIYKCCQKDEDFSLKVWLGADSNNRKLCPTCKSPIEKNGGCNHMTCWKCQCHMCWLCEKVFPTGSQVYSHQPYCPRTKVEPLIVF